LVLHLETILRALCQKNIILFKIGCHAPNGHKAFYHSSQPITYYLTTTDFSSNLARFTFLEVSNAIALYNFEIIRKTNGTIPQVGQENSKVRQKGFQPV